jgi:lipopolysaccharide export system ATP-binding protein
MILGLTRPNSGRVLLNEEDITFLPVHQRARLGMGFLPQEPSIFRKLTVEENILAILEALGLPAGERADRAQALLRELNIAHLAKSPAYTLSGGERRRAEITRALATEPRFMLLDEPFAGIDPIAVFDIQGIIGQLKDRGIGVLITDHNVRETLQIVDRAYIIHEGRILLSGTAAQLAADEVAREIYLGERFSL